jgi:hypothetical protein
VLCSPNVPADQHMTIILQEHAKRAIIADFGTWAANNLQGRAATRDDGLTFFRHLKADKQHLLQFRHPAPDKWQVVCLWLTGAGLVTED